MIPGASVLRSGKAIGTRLLHTATVQVASTASPASVGAVVVKDAVQRSQVKDSMEVQDSLTARAEQINLALSELRRKSGALKDPEDVRDVELHLRDLARRGHLIAQAKRKLDAILLERGQAW